MCSSISLSSISSDHKGFWANHFAKPRPRWTLLHILVPAAIFIVLAVSFDLLAGKADSFGRSRRLLRIGGIHIGLLTVNQGAPFGVGVLAGMAVAALISFVVSLPR